MEGLDVLFLVVQMGDKTHVIARSRIPQVNAGMVLEELGGGGHATAASAVVRDMTYLQTRERLIDILKRHIKPGQVASEIMTSPVKTIPSGSTIAEAGEAMTRFSVNVLPVLGEESYLGIITREVVQKALFHGLGKQKVNEFMTTGGPVGVSGHAHGAGGADHDRGASAFHPGHRPGTECSWARSPVPTFCAHSTRSGWRRSPGS